MAKKISKREIQSWYLKTDESADTFIERVGKLNHTYDSICHAVAAAAIKAAWQMNNTPNGVISGFQAGAVMFQFIRKWMHIEGPFRIVEYNEMLYPQYKNKFEKAIPKEVFESLQITAKKNLSKPDYGSNAVRKHQQSIVDGKVPFNYKISSDS